MPTANIQLKNPAQTLIKTRLCPSILPRPVLTVQEHILTQPTPELLIKTYGRGDDISLIIAQNLTTSFLTFLEYAWWIGDVKIIIKKLPADNFLRQLYERMMQHVFREQHIARRHIRFLGQCYDLINGTRIFTPQSAELQKRLDVAQLKKRVAIQDVIGKQIELRPAGHTLKGLCPFHSDKNPSFFVYPDTGRWWCFACGAGGDVIAFIQKIRNCTFREAVGELQRL